MDDMSEWKIFVGDRDMLLLEKIEELTLCGIRLAIKDLRIIKMKLLTKMIFIYELLHQIL